MPRLFSYEDMYFLLRGQSDAFAKWRKSGLNDDFLSFVAITIMIVRHCLFSHAYSSALARAHSCFTVAIRVGNVPLILSLGDVEHWSIKVERCLALNVAFKGVADGVTQLFTEATALYHSTVLEAMARPKETAHDPTTLIKTLDVFKQCVASAENLPEIRRLYCQALHECGDVCYSIAIASQNAGERSKYYDKSLEYYKQCIKECGKKFSDSIFADTLVAKVKTRIKVLQEKDLKVLQEKDWQELLDFLDQAYDLYKTAQDRAKKIKIVDKYRDLIENAIAPPDSTENDQD